MVKQASRFSFSSRSRTVTTVVDSTMMTNPFRDDTTFIALFLNNMRERNYNNETVLVFNDSNNLTLTDVSFCSQKKLRYLLAHV